jgi:hypothetical protein
MLVPIRCDFTRFTSAESQVHLGIIHAARHFVYNSESNWVLSDSKIVSPFVRGSLHVQILVRIPIRFGAHPISHSIRISAYFKLDRI